MIRFVRLDGDRLVLWKSSAVGRSEFDPENHAKLVAAMRQLRRLRRARRRKAP